MKPSDRAFHVALLVCLVPIFVWSAIAPHDRFTWWLEVAPGLAGIAVLALTYRRFTFSRLAYFLMFLHIIILFVGGHYTYARVPAFDWLEDALNLSRNHYDRVGHFAQGFVPAIIAREIFVRKSIIRGKAWLFFFIVCVCLAVSALYELIEWWTAVFTGEAATDFLGTQGDVWDTQMDMFLALTGAVSALCLLGKLHDRQMRRR